MAAWAVVRDRTGRFALALITFALTYKPNILCPRLSAQHAPHGALMGGARPSEVPLGYDRTGRFALALITLALTYQPNIHCPRLSAQHAPHGALMGGARPSEVPLGYDRTGRFALALITLALTYQPNIHCPRLSAQHAPYGALMGGGVYTGHLSSGVGSLHICVSSGTQALCNRLFLLNYRNSEICELLRIYIGRCVCHRLTCVLYLREENNVSQCRRS